VKTILLSTKQLPAGVPNRTTCVTSAIRAQVRFGAVSRLHKRDMASESKSSDDIGGVSEPTALSRLIMAQDPAKLTVAAPSEADGTV